MILDRVTVTGADDIVPPAELAELSREFPFVEWGVLFSMKKQGSARYPTTKWLYQLSDVSLTQPTMKLSAHLCGWYVQETIDGRRAWFNLHPYHRMFQRIQLNLKNNETRVIVGLGPLRAALGPHEALGPPLQREGPRETLGPPEKHSFIFRCGGDYHDTVRGLVNVGAGSPLFDSSGGLGIAPACWPMPWLGVYCGYAGGLRPDTVVREVERIAAQGPVHARFWIDIETGVRSNADVFDLTLVRQVLERCQPMVASRYAQR